MKMTTLGILTIAAFAVACDDSFSVDWPDLPSDAVQIAFDRLDEVHTTGSSAIADRRRQLIETPERWAQFWADLNIGIDPLPEAPAVDFETSVVAVASMGEQLSQGHEIAVAQVWETPGQIFVRVLERQRGGGCEPIPGRSQPVTAVVVERRPAAVEFQERVELLQCN